MNMFAAERKSLVFDSDYSCSITTCPRTHFSFDIFHRFNLASNREIMVDLDCEVHLSWNCLVRQIFFSCIGSFPRYAKICEKNPKIYYSFWPTECFSLNLHCGEIRLTTHY